MSAIRRLPARPSYPATPSGCSRRSRSCLADLPTQVRGTRGACQGLSIRTPIVHEYGIAEAVPMYRRANRALLHIIPLSSHTLSFSLASGVGRSTGEEASERPTASAARGILKRARTHGRHGCGGILWPRRCPSVGARGSHREGRRPAPRHGPRRSREPAPGRGGEDDAQARAFDGHPPGPGGRGRVQSGPPGTPAVPAHRQVQEHGRGMVAVC